ncbi:MAG: YraN family protein [Paracoccaceae bacterium]
MTIQQGRSNYYAGRAAEEAVARWYCGQGGVLCETRWRGQGGEIDLIVRDGDTVVFVEVKKSRDFDRAAQALSQRQMGRIAMAAGEFLDTQPAGSLTPARFDVALVDDLGRIEVLENAFGVC